MYTVDVQEASDDGVNIYVLCDNVHIAEVYLRKAPSLSDARHNLSVFVAEDQKVSWITPKEFADVS